DLLGMGSARGIRGRRYRRAPRRRGGVVLVVPGAWCTGPRAGRRRPVRDGAATANGRLLDVALDRLRGAWLRVGRSAAELLLAAALPQEVPQLVERHLDVAQLSRIVIGYLLQPLFLGDEARDAGDQFLVVHCKSSGRSRGRVPLYPVSLRSTNP